MDVRAASVEHLHALVYIDYNSIETFLTRKKNVFTKARGEKCYLVVLTFISATK